MEISYLALAYLTRHLPQKLMPQSQSDFHGLVEYAPIGDGAYNLEAFMKEIKLTQGKVALVDDEDFERVSQFKWWASKPCKTWYAGHTIFLAKKQYRSIRMHRFILNIPKGLQGDHRNGNGLDNRRENIRICTVSENQQNRHSTPGASGFKGIYLAEKKYWRARIYVSGVRLTLGCFTTPEEAAHAYDEAAIKYYGEFACTNFKETGKTNET